MAPKTHRKTIVFLKDLVLRYLTAQVSYLRVLEGPIDPLRPSIPSARQVISACAHTRRHQLFVTWKVFGVADFSRCTCCVFAWFVPKQKKEIEHHTIYISLHYMFAKSSKTLLHHIVLFAARYLFMYTFMSFYVYMVHGVFFSMSFLFPPKGWPFHRILRARPEAVVASPSGSTWKNTLSI